MSVNNNADDYANARVGIYFPGFPSSLTGQCVSLAKWFLGEMCNVSDWQAARGNAKDFGTILVVQGLATQVDSSNRQRGDLVVWQSDGGGYGHIGVLCSNDNVFEENAGIIGTPSENIDGLTVYAARIDSLNASWRVGDPLFYRVNGYVEVDPSAVIPSPAPSDITPEPPQPPVPTVAVPSQPVVLPTIPEPDAASPVTLPVSTVPKPVSIYPPKKNLLESARTISINMVVTFLQTGFAAWGANGFSTDRVILASIIGVAGSAVWNIVLKPSFKSLGWMQ